MAIPHSSDDLFSQGIGDFDQISGPTAQDPLLLDASSGEELVLPGEFLLRAEYGRSGPDLTITGEGGESAIVRDFFAVDQAPNLWTESGAVIGGDLAVRLAGPMAPGQVAQASLGAPGEPIGEVESAEGSVTATRADGTTVDLAPGDPVFKGDTIETGPAGLVELTLADGTEFSLEEDARMTLDELVYDGSSGSLELSVTNGVFAFISGDVAKTGEDAVTIRTPVATLGIRGTGGLGKASSDNADNFFTLLQGIIAVINGAGITVLDQIGATTTVPDYFSQPGVAEILNPAAIQNIFGAKIVSAVRAAQNRSTQRQQQQQNDNNNTTGNDDATGDDPGNDDPGNDDPGNDDPGNDDSGNDDSGNDDSEGQNDGAGDNGETDTGDASEDGDIEITLDLGALGLTGTLTIVVNLFTGNFFVDFDDGQDDTNDTGSGNQTGQTTPGQTNPIDGNNDEDDPIDNGGTDTLVNIENIDGSNFDDALIGDSGDNRLDGDDGSDLLIGGQGDDDLIGGRDQNPTTNIREYGDTVDYGQEGGPGGVTVDFASGRATDTYGDTDILVNVERVIGTANADILRGGFENFFEEFEGGLGADDIDGRTGFDQVSYEDDATAVTVDLSQGFAIQAAGTGNEATDTLANIESVEGSDFADTLIGGNATNDVFERFRGRAGDDAIDGGSGFDEADYLNAGATTGVSIDLSVAGPNALDGAGGTDTLVNIEGLRGTNFADTMTGQDGVDERFRGYAGADVIDGGSGDSDTIDYSNAGNNYAVIAVSVNLGAGEAQDGFGVTDTLIDIENAIGTNRDGDQLIGSSDLNSLYGMDGSDTLTGGAGNDRLDGGNDRDSYDIRQYFDSVRYDLEGGGLGVRVDLGHGFAFDSYGDTDSLVNVERVFGTDENDQIFGGAQDEFEEFIGGAGDDLIDGRSGFDRVSYEFEATGVTVNLATGQAVGVTAGTDTLSNIEAIEGSDFDDVVIGSNNGFEAFRMRAGNDTVTAGTGDGDMMDYWNSGATTGINISLAAGSALDGTGSTDSFSGIERVRGTDFDDVIAGDANDNEFRGMKGNDDFQGLAGSDTVNYSSEAANDGRMTHGVSANLTTGEARDGFGDRDTFSQIENLRGTQYTDVLIGSSDANTLRGDDGWDILVGNAGDDVLIGGDDFVAGIRQYFDTVDYSQETGFGGVSVNLSVGQAVDSFGDTDTLSGIERVVGTNQADALIGGAEDSFEEFDGRGGADSINGVSGYDRASYQYDVAGITGTITSVDVAGNGGRVVDGFGTTDTLSNIDSIEGSEYDDTLTVVAATSMHFRPRGGDDTFTGGSGGFDEIDYHSSGATAGVSVNLSAGSATDGLGGTDSFSGVERIRGSELDDTLIGDGNNNRFRGMAGNDVIDGAGGTDLADYSSLPSNDGSATYGVYIDLAGGIGRDSSGGVDRLTSIEDVRGTQYADTIIGDSNANSLDGGDGSDTLIGGAGSDTLNGNADVEEFDTVDYSRETGGGAVTVDLGAGTGVDTFGATDTLTGIERVIGTDGDDILTGGAATSFEEFIGGAGNDTIDGIDDNYFTQVSYQFDPSAVTATLVGGGVWTVQDGFGGTDTLMDVESIEGSDFNDVLVGGDGFQRFRPRNGADDIDGGAGVDEVDYRFSGGDRGVTADLSAGSATDTFGQTDTLTNIERLRGSAFDDQLTGDSGANRLRGEEGNDILVGKEGADNLIGGDGQDVFLWNDSGEGAVAATNDTPTNLSLSSDTISDFLTNIDRLVLVGAGFDGFSAGDTFETGVNFFVIGSEYDGTNAGAADSTARIVIDNQGNVVADGNGTGAGYTVVANVGSGTTVGTEDVQIV